MKTKKKKVKTKVQKPKKETKVLINFKFKPSVIAQMKANAKSCAKGNLTLWLTYAGLFYKPSEDDIL
jgi:hypothetical protein